MKKGLRTYDMEQEPQVQLSLRVPARLRRKLRLWAVGSHWTLQSVIIAALEKVDTSKTPERLFGRTAGRTLGKPLGSPTPAPYAPVGLPGEEATG